MCQPLQMNLLGHQLFRPELKMEDAAGGQDLKAVQLEALHQRKFCLQLSPEPKNTAAS